MESNQQGKDPQHLRSGTRSSFLGLELPFCGLGCMNLLGKYGQHWEVVGRGASREAVETLQRWRDKSDLHQMLLTAAQSQLVTLEVMQQKLLVGHSQHF